MDSNEAILWLVLGVLIVVSIGFLLMAAAVVGGFAVTTWANVRAWWKARSRS